MEKKSLSVEVPEKLKVSLDELARKTGRKKNILVGASLYNLLESEAEKQERVVQQYLNAYQE